MMRADLSLSSADPSKSMASLFQCKMSLNVHRVSNGE
jgi:hypothetical protein